MPTEEEVKFVLHAADATHDNNGAIDPDEVRLREHVSDFFGTVNAGTKAPILNATLTTETMQLAEAVKIWKNYLDNKPEIDVVFESYGDAKHCCCIGRNPL